MGVTGKGWRNRLEAVELAQWQGSVLLDGSRGLLAAYRHPGGLGPHEPCPSGPGITIDDTIQGLLVEAREERRYLERRMGTDMEHIGTFCEGACQKRCHLRVPAEESHEVTSCSSSSTIRCYRKRGSPKSSKGDPEKAIEMTPSPVRRMFSALWDCEGYHTCFPSDSTGIELDSPAGRSHTAPNPYLAHDADWES